MSREKVSGDKQKDELALAFFHTLFFLVPEKFLYSSDELI
jgi:hypothetical protein